MIGGRRGKRSSASPSQEAPAGEGGKRLARAGGLRCAGGERCGFGGGGSSRSAAALLISLLCFLPVFQNRKLILSDIAVSSRCFYKLFMSQTPIGQVLP